MNNIKKFGVYVGRFNPIHLGHVAVINSMIESHGVDKSLLIIGSSNAPLSMRHFFSYEERRNFIKKLYPNLKIVGLPDYHDDKQWLTALDDILRLGNIDLESVTFFGGCKEDLRFFDEADRHCSIYNRFDGSTPKVSATEVRDSLLHERPLTGLVEGEIAQEIKDLFRTKWEHFKKL